MSYISLFIMFVLFVTPIYIMSYGLIALGISLNVNVIVSAITALLSSAPIILGFIITLTAYSNNTEQKFRKYVHY